MEYRFETTPATYTDDIAANLTAKTDTRPAAPDALKAAVEACLAAADFPARANVEVNAAQGNLWLVVRVSVVRKVD